MPQPRRGPATTRLSLPARLRSPAQFGTVAAGAQIRLTRQWLALQARLEQPVTAGPSPATAPPPAAPSASIAAPAAPGIDCSMRFGLTVAKRNARRAVDRARIKRVLREAIRSAAPALLAAAAPRRVEVVLRLRAPWPAGDPAGRAGRVRALRAEADQLLGELVGRLGVPRARAAAEPA